MKRIMIHQARLLLLPVAIFAVVGMMLAFRATPTSLERVLERGELVIITRPSPTTYYHDQYGPTGMEYELAKGLADELGVHLRILEAKSIAYIQHSLDHGNADFAAAGLTITDQRKEEWRFTTPYQIVDERVVYRISESRPRSAQDLLGKKIIVLAGSSHDERLQQLQKQFPSLSWTTTDTATTEQLLTLVDEGYFDYTLIDSNAFAINRSLFPELNTGLPIGEAAGLAWAFNKGADDSLYQLAQRYLTRMKANGTVAALASRFYDHASQFNLYAARSFNRHMNTRLPLYQSAFEQASETTGLDWRLLAAMGYQESLWDAGATSPTGVRGLMMLTLNTAAEMGVADRTDPMESIRAGAEYLRKLIDRIPERIPQPDRTWMAIAAYNVGMGHLEDARILTQRQGGNPDRWQDVEKRLPLLKQAKYYRGTRHGYARGGAQSVIYVRHIRRYYDLLVWASNSEQRPDSTLLALATLD